MSAPRQVLAAVRGGTRAGHADRPPRTSLRAGPAVPALVLRLALTALLLGAGGLAGEGPTQWAIAAAVAGVAGVRPHAALLATGVGALVAMLALAPGPWWELPVLVLLTHAALRLGAVVDAVSWQGWVELGVLRDALPAFVGVQAVAQGAAVLALLLDGAAPLPWLVVGGVAALAALTWTVVLQLRTPTP